MKTRPILFSAPISGYDGRYTIRRDGLVVAVARNAPVAVATNNCGYATVLLRSGGKTKRHLIQKRSPESIAKFQASMAARRTNRA